MFTIGIIGAGQLAKMLALAGHNLGFKFAFYDPNPESCAFELGRKVIGEFNDSQKLLEFSQSVDFLTYEFENIPADSLKLLADKLTPSIEALKISQDRLLEKTFINDLNIKTAPFFEIKTLSDITKLLNDPQNNTTKEFILKTRRLGYDGKGQIQISKNSLISKTDEINSLLTVPCILEEKVEFNRELSLIAVASRKGEILYYPPAENVHKNGILYSSISPAGIGRPTGELAKEIVGKIIKKLNYVGIIAVELFEIDAGELIVNEIAPRVHNTGHWSIEGSVTSQFENHIRAVTELPLGDTVPYGTANKTATSLMFNVIGKTPNLSEALSDGTIKVHLYGKSEKQGRKLGHITCVTHERNQIPQLYNQIATITSKNNY